MRNVWPRLGVAAATAGMAWAAPYAHADAPVCGKDQCAFYTPSQHISCEIDDRVAYCQFIGDDKAYSVTVDSAGTLTPCRTDGCVGNPGLNQPTLAYGQAATLGTFTCRSATGGMTCTTAPSGRGFVISSAGITPVG